jgi:hypothetical protein
VPESADTGATEPLLNEQKRLNRWNVILVGASLVMGAFIVPPLLALGYLLWTTPSPPSQIEFDAATWRESPGKEVRWRMHEDLLKSGQLEGKTMPEVVTLLGPPSGYVYFSERTLDYNMGIEQESVFAIDNVWLVLHFDRNGILQRHEVATD